MIWSKDHIKRIKRAGTTLTVEDRHILWRHPLQLSSIKQSRQTGDKKVSPKFFTSTNSFSHSAGKIVDQRSIDLWELHLIPFFSYYFLLPFKAKPRKVLFFFPFKFLAFWALVDVSSNDFINLVHLGQAWIFRFGYVELWIVVKYLSLFVGFWLFFHL